MPLILTYALMLFCFASISASRLVLSLYALNLGAQPASVGLLVASFYIFPLTLSWPIGIFADRVGSRWPLFFGSVCGTLAMLIPYFGRTMPALYVAGTMMGLAFSFYNVLLQNLVGVLSKPHERAKNFSTASMVGAGSNFFGPVLAGVAIDHSGHAAACLYVAALSLGGAVMLGRWGGVLPGPRRHAPRPGGLRDVLAAKGAARLLATSSLVQAGQDLFQ
ncbi:MAG: MFS transporter, partial [Casimicrobiaceae bacterium]